MPFPNQDYNKRDCELPAGCKDLADSIKAQESSVSPPVSDPPITRQIALPEKVAVKYLAEISGQELHAIVTLMTELRIIVSTSRSVDFEDAVRILRRYGIAAERAA